MLVRLSRDGQLRVGCFTLDGASNARSAVQRCPSKGKALPIFARNMRLNQPIVGLILGLVMPLIGFIVVFFVKASAMGMDAFVSHLRANHDAAGVVITLSVLANLIPFLIFSRRRMDYAVKGVVIATILYALFFVYVKFVA